MTIDPGKPCAEPSECPTCHVSSVCGRPVTVIELWNGIANDEIVHGWCDVHAPVQDMPIGGATRRRIWRMTYDETGEGGQRAKEPA